MNVATTDRNFNGIQIVEENGEFFADSREVAANFDKRHADVLRAVSELDCSAEFIKRNFAFSTFSSEGSKRTYPYVKMTRDGFSFMVMGFTGSKAAKWKERYIEAFNVLSQRLSGPQLMAAALIEADATIKQQQDQIANLAPKAEAHDQLMNAEGLYGLQNAGRALSARPNLFISWLKQSYLFYQGNALVARVQYIQRGFFEVKTTIVDDKARPKTYLTPKGLEYFRTRLPDHIRMGGAA